MILGKNNIIDERYTIDNWADDGIIIVNESSKLIHLIVFNNVILTTGKIWAKESQIDDISIKPYVSIYKNLRKYIKQEKCELVINPKEFLLFVDSNEYLFIYKNLEDIPSIINLHFNPATEILNKIRHN